MKARERGGAADRGRVGRRRRVLRSLLVLRELVALRVRRARASRSRRSARPHGHRRPSVSRRSGERLPHALDRGDGRAPARRARGDRSGERRRHAHDEARVRRLPRDARRRSSRPTPSGCRPRSTARARPKWSPSTRVTPTVSAYSVVHGRDGAPEWALLVCDLARRKAHVRPGERHAISAPMPRSTELVGRNVTLKPQTVDGPMGKARVNHATW